MKYSEFDDQTKMQLKCNLDDLIRTNQQIVIEAGKQTTQYLLLVNSGSAVALLTYLGSSLEIRQIAGVWVALAIFCLGVVSLGVVLIYGFFQVRKIALGTANDTQLLYKEEITLADFIQRRPPIRVPKLPDIFGMTSFFCFIIGIVVATCSLYPVVTASGDGVTSHVTTPQGQAVSK